jgi:cytidylate kinase
MTLTGFLHRHTEALEHVLVGCCTEREPRYATPEQTALDRFTIAVSREAGTPASEVARQVGERLGWPVYEREVPERIAQALHLPVGVVEAIDERRQSWLLECLESFNSRCDLSESRYFRQLISVVRSLGEQGRCLIVGHGAEYLLPPHTTLRVFLVGAHEDRLAAFGRARHLDRWTASRQLDQIDIERSRFLREHFHVDPSQSRNYDLVLNTSQWSPSDCADFILRALHHKAMGQPRIAPQ